MIEIIEGQTSRVKATEYMRNHYAWLCKWVKSLPQMLPTAQISHLALHATYPKWTENTVSLTEQSLLLMSPLRHGRVLGKSGYVTWVPLDCAELSGGIWWEVCEAVLSSKVVLLPIPLEIVSSSTAYSLPMEGGRWHCQNCLGILFFFFF